MEQALKKMKIHKNVKLNQLSPRLSDDSDLKMTECSFDNRRFK